MLSSGGMLDDRMLASHAMNMGAADVSLLKAADAKVSVQPVSSAYLAMGMTPLMELLEQQVTVGIGTDDVNCNESVNLFSDMKMLALLWRVIESSPSAISPEKVIEMATIDGARAIGMADRIGSLEVGKLADVITVDLRTAQTTPMHHVPTTLVFGTYGTEVDTVIVDGKVVMERRQLAAVSSDEMSALYADASVRSRSIYARSGVQSNRVWSR